MARNLTYLSDYIDYRLDNNLTFTDFIEANRNITDTIIPETGLLDVYKDEIDSLLVTVEMTDNELERFEYRPKLLSNELYGTPFLAATILVLNGIRHPGEFDMKEIKFINPSETSLYELQRIISVYKEKFIIE